MRRKWIFLAPLIPVFIALFIFIGGEIVMRLWNWLLPSLFGFHQITFWQAVGLMALCRILFGGFGGRGFRRAPQRFRDWSWRRRMFERWDKMTPEEREKFRERMRSCGPFGPPAAEPKA